MDSERFKKFIICGIKTGNSKALAYAADFYADFQKGLRIQIIKSSDGLLVASEHSNEPDEKEIFFSSARDGVPFNSLLSKMSYRDDNHSYTLLQLAAVYGHPEIIKNLLEWLVPHVEQIDHDEIPDSPLKLAVRSKQEAAVRILSDYAQPVSRLPYEVPVVTMYIDHMSDKVLSVPVRIASLLKQRPSRGVLLFGALMSAGIAWIIIF